MKYGQKYQNGIDAFIQSLIRILGLEQEIILLRSLLTLVTVIDLIIKLPPLTRVRRRYW